MVNEVLIAIVSLQIWTDGRADELIAEWEVKLKECLVLFAIIPLHGGK
jgi:hypothetical protein